jgi:putative PIN family toxin of toxin-antitoxin system
MRVVLDTNVVLSGFFWNGQPRRLLGTEFNDTLLRITSGPLLDELSDVLHRTKFQHRLAKSPLSLDQLLHRYTESCAVVVPHSTPRIAPDPDDDVVIGTALAAKADLIVTGDRGLLSVGTYEGGRIVSVGEALQAIGLV